MINLKSPWEIWTEVPSRDENNLAHKKQFVHIDELICEIENWNNETKINLQQVIEILKDFKKQYDKKI